MPVTMTELKKLDVIDKVVIHSLDQSLYQVSVIIDKKESYVEDKDGKPLRSFNKLELQALFKDLPVKAMVLRHQSAYDEMVGLTEEKGNNTLEVPLGNTRFT